MLRQPNYHTYDNWKKMMDDHYNDVQCNIPENRIPSFTNHSVISPGLYPSDFGKRVMYRPLSFSMNWEIYAYNYPGITKEHMLKYENLAYNTKQNVTRTSHQEQDLSYIAFLLNMNVNLKQYEPEEMLEIIYGFDFLDDMMKEKDTQKMPDMQQESYTQFPVY